MAPPPAVGQQIWSAVQQFVPQQLEVCGQMGVGPPGVVPHGAGAQLPAWQTSPGPQAWPQLPQSCVSVERSTQRLPGQHESPVMQVQPPPLVPPEPPLLELPPPLDPPPLDEPPQLGQTHAPQPWGTNISVHGDGQ